MKTGDRVRLVRSPFEPWDISIHAGNEGVITRLNRDAQCATVDFEVQNLSPVTVPLDCLELA